MLSVSGFPESSPSLSSAEPSADSASESSHDGHKGLINRPVLRGLFGRRPGLSVQHDDLQYNHSPPSSPTQLSNTPIHLQMTFQTSDPSPLTLHRPPLLSQPSRKRAPPLVGRLEIGSMSKPNDSPLRMVPIPPAVVQQWSSKSVCPPSSSPRPLPTVPGFISAKYSSENVSQPRDATSKASLSRARSGSYTASNASARCHPMPVKHVEKSTLSPVSSSIHSPVIPGTCVRPLPPLPSLTPVSPVREAPRIKAASPKQGRSSSAGPSTRGRPRPEPIPSSWASKPVDLHKAYPTQPTLPPHHPQASPPRAQALYSAPHDSRAPPIPRVTTPASSISAPSSAQQPYKPSWLRLKAGSPLSSPSLETIPLNPSNDFFFRPDLFVRQKTTSEDNKQPSVTVHKHPIERGLSKEQVNVSNPSGSSTPDPPTFGPDEVFIDDSEYTFFSRSPSPIRYARPTTPGSLSDESPAHSRSPSPELQTGGQLSRKVTPRTSRSPSPISYARRSSFDETALDLDLDELTAPPRRRVQPRSFQVSHPGSTGSLLEGRASYHQDQSSRASRSMGSLSPKRYSPFEDSSVIDISLNAPRSRNSFMGVLAPLRPSDLVGRGRSPLPRSDYHAPSFTSFTEDGNATPPRRNDSRSSSLARRRQYAIADLIWGDGLNGDEKFGDTNLDPSVEEIYPNTVDNVPAVVPIFGTNGALEKSDVVPKARRLRVVNH